MPNAATVMLNEVLNRKPFDGVAMTDIELSLSLNHRNVDESTVLLTSALGDKLYLCGCIRVLANDKYYVGKDVFELCETDDDFKDMMSFLNGGESMKYEQFLMDNNPFLEWSFSDGSNSDVFCTIEGSEELMLNELNSYQDA